MLLLLGNATLLMLTYFLAAGGTIDAYWQRKVGTRVVIIGAVLFIMLATHALGFLIR